MKETIWSMSQQTRKLQELRQDIQPVWADEAAREVNGKYLEPHNSDSQEMLSTLEQQAQMLEQVQSALQVAQTDRQQADEYAAIVTEQLELTEQDVQVSYSHYDLYIQCNSDATAIFPQVGELVNRANAACNGIPGSA